MARPALVRRRTPRYCRGPSRDGSQAWSNRPRARTALRSIDRIIRPHQGGSNRRSGFSRYFRGLVTQVTGNRDSLSHGLSSARDTSS